MSEKYQLTEGGVLDLETGASIPNAEGNRHWREFQAWLAEDPENNVPRPVRPSSFHSWDDQALEWVEDTVASQAAQNEADIDQLERANRATLRLLMTLIDQLLTDNVIQAGNFTPAEINLYQSIKAKRDLLYP